LVRLCDTYTRNTKTHPMKTINAVTFKKSVLALSLFVFTLTHVSAQIQESVSGNNNVPALLLGFSGEMGSGSGVLSWTMENETNSKLFIIERSSAADGFDSIGQVASLNNNHATNYNFTDSKLLSGNNYYRLRMVSMDGVVKYSKVICLDNVNMNNSAVAGMQVYPNPVVSTVNYRINSPAIEQAVVQVYNLSGVLVMSEQTQLSAGLNQQSIVLTNLKNGNYFLKVRSTSGTQYTQSFVKYM